MKVAVFLAILPTLVLAKPEFAAKIPNGGNVPNPCATDGSKWAGVGHTNPSGGGSENDFGEAFEDAGLTWTTALCQADTDGDGKTNGEELGDPNCTWKQGDANPSGTISHPGVCEPVTSSTCKSKNSWASSCPTAGGSNGIVSSWLLLVSSLVLVVFSKLM